MKRIRTHNWKICLERHIVVENRTFRSDQNETVIRALYSFCDQAVFDGHEVHTLDGLILLQEEFDIEFTSMRVRTVDSEIKKELYQIQQKTRRYRDHDWDQRVVFIEAITNETVIKIDGNMTVFGQVFTTSDRMTIIPHESYKNHFEAVISLDVGDEIIIEAVFSGCQTKMYCTVKRTE